MSKGPMVPKSKPQMARAVVEMLQKKANITDAVSILGIRGYYDNNNARGIYDDAILVLSPEGLFAFNANVDPSVFRKGIASLKKGVWKYKIGIHGLSKPKAKRYTALVQAAKVTVVRDGKGEETGYFGINLHRGGLNSTSSLGCNTIYPKQWPAFIALIQSELKRHGQKVVSYHLIDKSDVTG